MDMSELRRFTIESLGKNPDTEPAVPEWDSLDRLEIITNLHDKFGDAANEIPNLENFTDLDNLGEMLRERGLVD
ncbi:MAG: hypothetical protein KKH51_05020 [Actinobacteria bacterium]|nr:hypothetical protein [Actinomycetota bacterium]